MGKIQTWISLQDKIKCNSNVRVDNFKNDVFQEQG